MSKHNNIHPVFNLAGNRSDKESHLNQHARIIWLTGLSSSGKSTISQGLEIQLIKRGFSTQALDGDNVRAGLCNDLGFTEKDRFENIRRISEVSKLFLDCGIICINSFISPTKKIRQMAMSIIGKENFIEIYVNAPIEICKKRDVHGLYQKAMEGKIKYFTGIGSPYEAPEQADIVLKTDELSIEESVAKCLKAILPIIEYK